MTEREKSGKIEIFKEDVFPFIHQMVSKMMKLDIWNPSVVDIMGNMDPYWDDTQSVKLNLNGKRYMLKVYLNDCVSKMKWLEYYYATFYRLQNKSYLRGLISFDRKEKLLYYKWRRHKHHLKSFNDGDWIEDLSELAENFNDLIE